MVGLRVVCSMRMTIDQPPARVITGSGVRPSSEWQSRRSCSLMWAKSIGVARLRDATLRRAGPEPRTVQHDGFIEP